MKIFYSGFSSESLLGPKTKQRAQNVNQKCLCEQGAGKFLGRTAINRAGFNK